MESMRTLTLTIGHNVGNVPTWSTSQVCNRVHMILNCEGFTAFPCLGMWNGAGEESTRVEICGTAEELTAYIQAIPALCRALNQVCILVQAEGLACYVYSTTKAEELTA